MENFYNYEQVLNALKVEYVNARNLKKVANSAKRATKNAASFSNRKVNEKTTLENRVDSIESVMDSTLSNAINEADQKKWTDLKSKLSELKGKLKNIENGEYLLVQSTLINPLDLNNQYEEVSTMDSSSFNMLKNLLNTAINDAETAINAAYSTDYNTLSQATIIRYGESELSNNQIMAKYLEKKSTLESLFQKAESAIDEYVNDIFSEVDGVKGREGDCVSQSRTLSYKKDELATLLVNEGSQSDIDQKELEIESIKQLMIQHANELKLAKIKLEQKAEDRFKIVAEYIEDARDYADEDFYQFINQNQYFLRDTGEPNIAELTDYRTGNLYSSLFDKLAQSTQIQGISESEYTQFKNEVDNARTNLMGLNNIIIRNVLRDQTLEYPQNLIEEVGDGKFEFKSYVPTNDIKFYKDYNRALHIQTSEYIIRKADRDSKRIELRDMVFTEAGSVINKMQQTYTDIRDTKWHLRKAHKFHKLNTELYTGTQEQQSAYNDFISEHNQAFYLFNQTEQTYQYNQATYQFNLGIFENEFNLLNTLTTTKTSTEDYLSTLSSSGGIDSSFAYGSGFDADANSVAIQSDGKILVGGEFTSYNGTSANKIIRLNSDGSIDTSFIYGTGFDNDVTSIAIQSDGKILVGGYFFTYNGTFANRIIRLNSDGSVDTSFVIGTGFDSDVDSTIVIQSDGKILVGGSFTDYNGTPANYIIRLNSDGSVDTSFVTGTGFDSSVFSIAIQSDGKIVVGGYFWTYNGTSANKIIRLNSDGSRDTSFVTGTGIDGFQIVQSIAIQSDGAILVGGDFSSYNGTSAKKIIRLNSDGSVDTSFSTGSGFHGYAAVYSIAIQSDGKIVVGGGFHSYNGTPANYIIRLNSDGSVDTSFVYGTGLNGYTKSFAIQSDGKIVVAGQFQSYNGTSANFIIRLNSDGDEAYPEALISRNAAIEEYNLFLDTKFGEEWFGLGLNQFTTGQLLLDMKNARDTSYASYAAAETAWNTELAEFEVLKSQMTLEEVDDFYKKEGIRSAHDISNAEDRLANLENRESGLQWHLVQIGNQATIMITNSPGSFREVSDAQFEESQLASLLGGVKNFLDSENNLLAINKKEIHSKESLKRKLEREMEGMQMGRPMNPSLPQGVFGAASAGESLLFSSEPYQWKNQLMSGINNIIIRFNPDSFADAIIAEATNGTRWW